MSADKRDAELEDLRQRLSEAEETLRAIYHGVVDALVVRGPDGPQIFTLRGAQEPYRAFVEHMNEGALTLAQDGTILYSNRHFADLLECPLEQIVGKPLAMFVAPRDHESLSALLADGGKRSVRRELCFLRSDRSGVPALAAAGPLVVDESAALLLIVTDLTAQKQSEEVAAAERFARSILEQATDAVVVYDRAGRITKASWAAERLLEAPLVGEPVMQAVPIVLVGRDQPEALRRDASADTLLAAALSGKSFHGVEARIRKENLEDRHFLLSAGPLYDHAGEGIGCIITLTDISERKRAEQHQAMLVAELNHRVKNILAVVQSVAWQTLANSRTLPDFRDAFDGRLKAISLAHDILTQIRWGHVEIEQLVARSLAPYRGPQREGMVTWSGPSVLLAAQTVVPLSMVLHELSTNAAKYGAFSSETGTLAVGWRLVDADRIVELTWTERGGPPVKAQNHPGFGTKLITHVISYDLHGRAELAFDREGFRCTLTFPLPEGRAVPAQVAGSARAAAS